MRASEILIIPIFIPHKGCPYRCVFCSQTDITGVQYKADEEYVFDVLKTYLGSNLDLDHASGICEVAFYGGSFTGLPKRRQELLLSTIKPLFEIGRINSIRVSTHPLLIDCDRLDLIKAYNVKTVELGVQSTNKEILDASGRPCSIEEIFRSISLIKEHNFTLGLQLMLGLPGDSESRFMRSVKDVISIEPNFVRLYPTLILRHTKLYSMYKRGLYLPWSLDRTLKALKKAVRLFNEHSIPVIRVGVHPDPSLHENLVAGPFHPSLRYLVDCLLCQDLMVSKIRSLAFIPQKITFKVPRKMLSVFIGSRRENIRYIKDLFDFKEVSLIGEDFCKDVEMVT